MLNQNFQSMSTEDWNAAIQRELKGRAIEDLYQEIEEGITMPPFVHSDTNKAHYQPIPSANASGYWQICDVLVFDETSEVKAINASCLAFLGQGAQGLIIESDILNPSQLGAILEGVKLEAISLQLRGEAFSIENINGWLLVLKDLVASPEALLVTINCNTESLANATNKLDMSLLESMPGVKVLGISTSFMSGASYTEEIAYLLSETHNLLESSNSANLVQNQLHLSLKIGPKFYAEIAKIRALKLCLGRIYEFCKLPTQKLPLIHAEISLNPETSDPNNALIEATTQTLSAALGGVQSISIETAPSDNGSEFKRLALNIQHVLQLEASIGKVIDPLAGAYYIETLTDLLAEKAWNLFAEDL